MVCLVSILITGMAITTPLILAQLTIMPRPGAFEGGRDLSKLRQRYSNRWEVIWWRHWGFVRSGHRMESVRRSRILNARGSAVTDSSQDPRWPGPNYMDSNAARCLET